MAAETHQPSFTVWPIGTVEKSEDAVRLRIFEPYADALKGLGDFSHVCVLWWFHENDTPENRAIHQVRPRRGSGNLRRDVLCRRGRSVRVRSPR